MPRASEKANLTPQQNREAVAENEALGYSLFGQDSCSPGLDAPNPSKSRISYIEPPGTSAFPFVLGCFSFTLPFPC